MPGIYVVVVALAGLPVVFCSGDKCPMFVGLALLPWTMVPVWIPFQIRDVLSAIDYLVVFLGFAGSVAVLHFIGRWIDAGTRRAS